MSGGRVSTNLIANLAGSATSLLANIMLVPLYLRFLGVEAYGLIGLSLTLQLVLALFDFGLATALNRELARSSAERSDPQAARDLVRTLELIYGAIALLLGLGIYLLAPFIADSWLRPERLSPEVVRRAVGLMGLALGLQWPTTLYAAAFSGLQRQVLQNALQSLALVLRGAGAVLVLWQVDATIEAFLRWQAVASGVQTLLLGLVLWQILPAGGRRARFDGAALRRLRTFAGGMTGIAAVSLVLSQLDKVVLSKLLSLRQFGHYSLAVAVASSLVRVFKPVFAAVFPRMSQLVAAGEQEQLAVLYHRGARALAVLLLPVATVMACFPGEVMLAWTGDPEVVSATRLVLTLLVVGYALNGLFNMPYALQLAHGWTSPILVANTIAVLLLLPLLVWSTRHYGAVGAAALWAGLNASYVLIVLHVTHARLLPGHQWSWYGRDIGGVLLCSSSSTLVLRWVFAAPASRAGSLLLVSAAWFVAQALATWSTPEARRWLRSKGCC